MPGSTASLESLSSPSPSPPPSKPRASPPLQSSIHDPTGLDTGSELSELTEDEQESAGSNSKTSLYKHPIRRTRRSLVPDQMWGWYKKKSDEKAQAYSEQEEEEELDNRGGGKVIQVMEEEEDEDGAHEANSNTHDQPPPQPTAPIDNLEQTSLDDSDSEAGEEYASGKGKQNPDENDAEDSDSDTDDAGDEEDDGEEDPTDFEDDDQGEGEAQDSMAPSFVPTVATVNADRPETTMPIGDVNIIPLATTAAAAASSIMAGSAVIKPLSPASSTSSSRSSSPRPVSRKGASKVENGDIADTEAADIPVPADEVDENPEDDVDHELESDLQPAHRAEALDVLATIELKFALLRERLYVEKMEALSWEESLLGASTHPELIHLDEELSKRRDKRLELASRRRALEAADARKRKRVDEDAVWSWWKYERDELQTEMLSETNRKRRRLQRETRSLERPLPVRRIPHIQHELPPPPTLRDITRSMTYTYASGRMLAVSGAYPSLTMLSGMEVDGDLDFLSQHRRSWDIHRGNSQMMHHPFESYGPIEGAAGYGIIPPPPQLQANFLPQSHHSVAFTQHGRQDTHQYPITSRSISPVPVHNGGPKPPNGWMSGPGVMPEERVIVTKDSRRDEMRLIKEDRERERDMDRERSYQLQLMQQQQQRHQQQHQHGGGPNHHSHHHHHHVVHHHHPSASAVLPSSALSPRRVARDLEFSRPRSGPPPSTEVIDLSSSAVKRSALTTSPAMSTNSGIHETGIARFVDHTRPPSSEYDRAGAEHSRLHLVSNNSERVMTPFVIPPSQATQAHFSAPSDPVTNSNTKRPSLTNDDPLHQLQSTSQGTALVHQSSAAPGSRVHSPSFTRPTSNISLLVSRPQSSSTPQNTSPRTNRPTLPLPLRSPGPSTSPLLQLPMQPSPQQIPTPAALIASANGQNKNGPVSSPKPAIKQVIDPALSEISGGGRPGLILNIVPLSLHPSSLPAPSDVASPAATPVPSSRMNGVSLDGS